MELCIGDVACAHTRGEERVRLALGKLEKIFAARKEGGQRVGGEWEPVLRSLALGTSFCEGNRKPKPFLQGVTGLHSCVSQTPLATVQRVDWIQAVDWRQMPWARHHVTVAVTFPWIPTIYIINSDTLVGTLRSSFSSDGSSLVLLWGTRFLHFAWKCQS